MNVLFLTTLPTLKACNSPYMQYYFKRFFVLHSSEVIFSFLIKKSRQKAIEIKIAFFIPLGIPGVAHWIISIMLHISVITSVTNWYLYWWVSWNIFEVINETVQVHLIIWTTLVCARVGIRQVTEEDGHRFFTKNMRTLNIFQYQLFLAASPKNFKFHGWLSWTWWLGLDSIRTVVFGA